MAFLQEELRNLSFKSVVAGVLGTRNRSSAPDNGTYYEEIATAALSVNPSQILSEIALVPEANNLSTASSNAGSNPTIIKAFDGTANPAIHLTPASGNKAFFATEVYNDLSTRMSNFIMPQMVPLSTGFPSIGYSIRLYNGDPSAGGTEITTTAEQVGADVGWVASYGAGAIITASSFTGITDPTDVWMIAFQYIGATGSASGSVLVDNITIEESIGLEKMSSTGYYAYDVIRDYWFTNVDKGVDDPDDYGSWQAQAVADGVMQVPPNSTFMLNYNDSEAQTTPWPAGTYSIYSNRDLDAYGLKMIDSSNNEIFANPGIPINGLFKYDFNLVSSIIIDHVVLSTPLSVPMVFMLIDKINPEIGDKITIKHINSIIDANEFSIDGSNMTAIDGTTELPTRRYVDTKVGSGDNTTIQKVVGYPDIKIVSDPRDMLRDAWDSTLPGDASWDIGNQVTYDSSTGIFTIDYDSSVSTSGIIMEGTIPYSKTGQAGIYRFISSLDFNALGLKARIFVTTSYHFKQEVLSDGLYMYSIYSPKNLRFSGLHIEGTGITATIDIKFVDSSTFPAVDVYKIEEIDHIIDDDYKSIDPLNIDMIDSHRELVTRAYVDKKGSAYAAEFTSTDLVSGYLTVTHNLNAMYNVCNVTIMDENNNSIEPDNILFTSKDILIVDLRMLDPISGTWSIVVITQSDIVVLNTVPPAYINGSYINARALN